MFCRHCGIQMPEGSTFCPSCGKSSDVNTASLGGGKWKKISIALVFICAIAVIGIIISSCKGERDSENSIDEQAQPQHQMTVEEYRRECIQSVKNAIAPWVRTRPEIVLAIERKHGTVTVDQIDLKSLYVHTYDNTGFIQNDESNVESVELVIRFWWDGIFHQDGHTDVQFVLVPQGDDCDCRKCCVVETDALIDLDDPAFWAGVGAMLFL